ncbi:hypothetical protein [Magnetospirillum molischianum]|uniref:Uncharacterized protein n=1 Tax=Magnetospirillum molischianum DSM 120 TaxID=1150626 RepID=H8FY01_MAGML|nr:hypothetical protein [Magnetospirillum molischianum]CCG43239.1 hypothetical protein PHAMO_80030 [Magnetospirillum molischianum DSM 120]
MTELAYNPRYANYARAHGRTPEEQVAQDHLDWPGGSMCGFMLWNREKVGEFGKVNPDAFMAGGLWDHAAYDAWLTAEVDKITATWGEGMDKKPLFASEELEPLTTDGEGV